MISILIFTLNEERNLPDCLKSVAWSDDITVLDSGSTDGTIELARRAGARAVTRKLDDWASHQNWALANLSFRHDWVFNLDADERMPQGLTEEILGIARNDREERVAFYCGRRNFFMGKWIKHAMPPGMVMRFFRPGRVKFERLVNSTAVIEGRHGYLRYMLDHHNFSKGISEWIEKHNWYSSLEAQEGHKLDPTLQTWRQLSHMALTKDRADRRRGLKQLSFRLPGRAFAKFVYMYFLKRGFLDGKEGLAYCILQSLYEYMIVLKMWEIRRGFATDYRIRHHSN